MWFLISNISIWFCYNFCVSGNYSSHCVFPFLLGPLGFPCGSAGKESACNGGDLGSIPGLGRSPGEGKGYPLQHFGLENSVGCILHGVAKSRTQLSDLHFHFTKSFSVTHSYSKIVAENFKIWIRAYCLLLLIISSFDLKWYLSDCSDVLWFLYKITESEVKNIYLQVGTLKLRSWVKICITGAEFYFIFLWVTNRWSCFESIIRTFPSLGLGDLSTAMIVENSLFFSSRWPVFWA